MIRVNLSQLSFAQSEQIVTPLRTQQHMMYILGHFEGHDDLSDRDRNPQEKQSKSSTEAESGCPAANVLAVYTLRKIKPRTRQAHHSKANYRVRVISSRGRI